MRKLLEISKQFRDDDNGAAMVEYTILLGLIAAATIATIIVVAAWVTGAWGELCTALDSAATVTGCTPPGGAAP